MDILDAVRGLRPVTSVEAAVPLVIWFGGALFGSAATIVVLGGRRGPSRGHRAPRVGHVGPAANAPAIPTTEGPRSVVPAPRGCRCGGH